MSDKQFPGLTVEETAAVKRHEHRCWECAACEVVKSAQKVLMPNPPFSYASTATVETWNRCLVNNPCKNPTKG